MFVLLLELVTDSLPLYVNIISNDDGSIAISDLLLCCMLLSFACTPYIAVHRSVAIACHQGRLRAYWRVITQN